MEILIALCVILFVLFILFVCIALPVWAIIHCLSSDRSTISKVIWVVLILIFWSFSACVYGIFSSKNKPLQWTSVFSIVAMVVSILIGIYALNWAVKGAESMLENITYEVDSIMKPDLDQKQVDRLKQDFVELKQEIKADALQIEKKMKAVTLIELYEVFTKDNMLTIEEYTEWHGKFSSRALLDAKELNSYVQQLKKQ